MVGVIVINFGNPDRTIRFVQEECSKIKMEHSVIVVDNGSGPDTVVRLQSELKDTATILPNSANEGFARANNLGAIWLREHVNPGYILFTNNDIRLREDNVVECLQECISDHPEVAAAGPEIIGPDGCRQGPEPKMSFAQRHLLPYWGKLFLSSKSFAARISSNYAQNAIEGWHYRISGAFFLVRADDFYSAGMFDPNTFLYGEESILSERFAAIDKKVWFCPRVGVFHEHGATTGQWYKYAKVRRLKFKSESYYFRRYIGTPLWQIWLGSLTLWIKEIVHR